MENTTSKLIITKKEEQEELRRGAKLSAEMNALKKQVDEIKEKYKVLFRNGITELVDEQGNRLARLTERNNTGFDTDKMMSEFEEAYLACALLTTSQVFNWK